MMQPMRAHPEHGAAFQRHGSANCEKIFQPARTLIGLMGVQAMIAQTDPPSDRHPMQGDRNEKRFPTKEKEGGYRAYVKAHKDYRRNPVHFLAVGEFNRVFTHFVSAQVE
jgi:hypothetical protein